MLPLKYRPSRHRRGSTLVLMLLALAVLGALAAGSFFAAFQEQRIESMGMLRVRALAAAEHAAYTAISPRNWRASWSAAPAVWLVASDSASFDNRGAVVTQIWKLTPSSALIIADASAGSAPRVARRRISLFVGLRRPLIPMVAAAIAHSGVSVRDGSSITGGVDSASADCLTDDTVAAISLPSDASVDTAGCAPLPCLRAARLVRDTVLAALDETYERFGQVDRSFLAAAGRQLAGGIGLTPSPVVDDAGACDTNVLANLGDPLRILGPDSPCLTYFPLLHAGGGLTLRDGAGQGLLIVDGDLTLGDGAHFSGVAIVRGTARLESRSRVDGILIADRVSLVGASEIHYSACAVDDAARSGARPWPDGTHSWADMF